MENAIMVDTRLKNKIESLMDMSHNEICCYMVRFKDLEDTFIFDNYVDLQEFMHTQARERFYDKELRQGYFDCKNEYNDTLRYHVESKRGTLKVIKEECL